MNLNKSNIKDNVCYILISKFLEIIGLLEKLKIPKFFQKESTSKWQSKDLRKITPSPKQLKWHNFSKLTFSEFWKLSKDLQQSEENLSIKGLEPI